MLHQIAENILKSRLFYLLAALIISGPSVSDEICLTNGSNLNGTVLHLTVNSILILKLDGKTSAVKRTDVKSIGLNFAAGNRWARLIGGAGKNSLLNVSSFQNNEFQGKDELGKAVQIALGDILEASFYPVVKLSHILDIPYVWQKPDFCGEACIEMFSTFLDRQVSQDKVNELAGLGGKRGCYGEELSAVIKKLNLKIASEDGWPGKSEDDFIAERARLLACLQKNHPVILGIWGNYQTKQPRLSFDHIVLLIGYDLKNERFIIHDPGRMPDWEVPFTEFIKHRQNSRGELAQIEFALFKTWKMLDGTELPAELLEINDQNILLKPEKGDNITLAIDKLDAASMAFLEKLKLGKKAAPKNSQTLPQDSGPDPYALYSSARDKALAGDKTGALSFLAQAVEAGFINFVVIQNDKNLNSIREEKGFRDLLANKEKILADFIKKTADAFLKTLGEKYKVTSQDGSPYIMISDLKTDKLKDVEGIFEQVSGLLFNSLFKNKPTTPLIVVIPKNMQDFVVKMGGKRTSAGFYNHSNRTLTVNLATGTGTIVHEFTHALHFFDMEARQQMHPKWVIEGLGSLYEQSDLKGDHLEGKVNWRLPVLKNALKSKQAYKLRELFENSLEHFKSNAGLSYAMSRYVFYFLQEKHLLFPWYAQYCENYQEDPSGIQTLEKIFGKPLVEFEKDWIEFVSTLK